MENDQNNLRKPTGRNKAHRETNSKMERYIKMQLEGEDDGDSERWRWVVSETKFQLRVQMAMGVSK